MIGQEGDQLRWELRSVNAKGLDIRLKLPNGFETKEADIKRHIQKRFKRGNIYAQCTLVKSEDAKTRLDLNVGAIENYLAQRQALEKTFGPFAPLDIEKIALDTRFHSAKEQKTEGEEALLEPLTDALASGIDALEVSRLSEGQKLQAVLLSIIEQMRDTLAKILAHGDEGAAHLKSRLEAQIATLIGDHTMDQNRLAQEVAILATKADIREETDRLQAHCEEAKMLLESADPIGRRLDFLAQEFSREANTLCAKAATNEITRLGLDLKTMIDQFREQTQNVE